MHKRRITLLALIETAGLTPDETPESRLLQRERIGRYGDIR